VEVVAMAEYALNYGDILLYSISTYQLFIDTVISGSSLGESKLQEKE